MNTMQVYFDDSQGNLVIGHRVDPNEWSADIAARRARLSAGNPDGIYGVAVVDGREYVVKAVIDTTRIYWKAV